MKSVTLTFLDTGHYHCNGLNSLLPLALDGLLTQKGCSSCPVFSTCRMSHWTQVEASITDLAALKAACAELGCSMEANASYRIRVKADKQPNGAYRLSVDDMNTLVGKNAGKLLQLYGVHKATAAAKLKGYSVARKQQGTKIQLTVTAY